MNLFTRKLASAVLLLGLVTTSLVVASPAMAKTAKQELIDYVQKYSSFTADYTQVAKSPRGQVINHSQGQLRALKPYYLLLHTTSPNELYLSVIGKNVENYDPFVEQVTKSTLKAGETVPFLYLLNNNQRDWQHITVTKHSGCYLLTDPAFKDKFKRLQICLNRGQLSQVIFFERNGNSNTYTLRNFKARALKPTDFALHYPESTAVQVIK